MVAAVLAVTVVGAGANAGDAASRVGVNCGWMWCRSDDALGG